MSPHSGFVVLIHSGFVVSIQYRIRVALDAKTVWGAVWEDGGGVEGDGLVVDVFQPWLEPAPAVAAQASAVDSAAAHGDADETHHHHHHHHHHHRHDDHHDATEHHHDGHSHVHSDRLTTELVAIAKVYLSASIFSNFHSVLLLATFCCCHFAQ